MASAKRSKRRKKRQIKAQSHVGMAPGVPVYVGERRDASVVVRAFTFDETTIEDIRDPDLATLTRCAAVDKVSWVDLDGVHDVDRVTQIGEIFNLHPLWLEDILNPSTRPKVEWLGDKMFVIVRLIRPAPEEEGYVSEQVAMVLGPTWVLSFQEQPGDAWEAVRDRIHAGTGRIRRRGSDYLLHALVDALVDQYFLIMQGLEPRLDELEDRVLTASGAMADLPHIVSEMRSDLSMMRGAVWPLREAVMTLLRGEGSLIAENTVPFFRDLSDHLGQLSEVIGSSRERLQDALELHVALASHQMNEVMRVLTVVSTVFIPLSFLAGLYGMNFVYMPELQTPWGYPLLLAFMAAMAGLMLRYFRRKGWW